MYNLFVSAKAEAWEGDPFVIETSRCVRENEYTAREIAETFGELDAEAEAELKWLPCIFAYESQCQKPPRFGVIRKITRLQERDRDEVRIEYKIKKVDNFLTYKNLDQCLDASASELGIHDEWEMNRTHWAVKDIYLAKILKARGISLPGWEDA